MDSSYNIPLDKLIFQNNNINISNENNVLSLVDQLLSKEIQELFNIESDLQAIKDKIPERAEAYVQNRQHLANQLHKVQDNINNQLSQARKYEATLKPIVNNCQISDLEPDLTLGGFLNINDLKVLANKSYLLIKLIKLF